MEEFLTLFDTISEDIEIDEPLSSRALQTNTEKSTTTDMTKARAAPGRHPPQQLLSADHLSNRGSQPVVIHAMQQKVDNGEPISHSLFDLDARDIFQHAFTDVATYGNRTAFLFPITGTQGLNIAEDPSVYSSLAYIEVYHQATPQNNNNTTTEAAPHSYIKKFIATNLSEQYDPLYAALESLKNYGNDDIKYQLVNSTDITQNLQPFPSATVFRKIFSSAQ